jgi:hypothetical protein
MKRTAEELLARINESGNSIHYFEKEMVYYNMSAVEYRVTTPYL